MTEPQVVTTNRYGDIIVRAITDGSQVMIPVIDIANAVKQDRGNLTKSLKRPIFKPHLGVVQLPTGGGTQPLKCITLDGMMGLLLPMILLRSNEEAVQDRIMAFQQWAKTVLVESLNTDMHMQQEGRWNLPPCRTQKEIINHHLDIADIAITRSGVPKEIAHGMAWSMAAEQHEELNAYASFIRNQKPAQLQLPEAVPISVKPADIADYEMMFPLTKVAEFVGLSSDKTRNLLETLKVICIQNGTWRLTKYGEAFGRVFMIRPGHPYSTYEKPYIKYKPEAVELLRKHLAGV